MGGNSFYKRPDLLFHSVSVIQDSAHTIDLSFNGLDKVSTDYWTKLCSVLPRHIDCLDLSNNKLGRWEFAIFKNNMNQIPNTISDICLYNTTFDAYPEQEFQAFLASHGTRIKTGPMPENNFLMRR